MNQEQLFSGLDPIHAYVSKKDGKTTVFFPNFLEFLNMNLFISGQNGGHFRYIQQELFKEYPDVDTQDNL